MQISYLGFVTVLDSTFSNSRNLIDNDYRSGTE